MNFFSHLNNPEENFRLKYRQQIRQLPFNWADGKNETKGSDSGGGARLNREIFLVRSPRLWLYSKQPERLSTLYVWSERPSGIIFLRDRFRGIVSQPTSSGTPDMPTRDSTFLGLAGGPMTHGRRGEFSEKALTTKGGAFCFPTKKSRRSLPRLADFYRSGSVQEEKPSPCPLSNYPSGKICSDGN